MPELALVADDLTSATDCGVQIARWGLSVTVPLRPVEAWPALPPADVMSVTTESRLGAGADAYALTRRAAQQLWDIGYRHFYKSMDSTLRGHVAEELHAVLEVANPDVVIAAPAFPTYGRTTQAGWQLLRGTPMHLTEFGTDPVNPVRDANLAGLLAPLGSAPTLLGLAEVRAPESELAAKLAALADTGHKLIICDAAEEGDLARVVRAVARAQLRPTWLGSTGLAGHVGAYFRPAPLPTIVDLPEHPRPGLIIAGTASEHTRQQFDVLAQRTDVAILKANARALAGDEAETQAEHDRGLAFALHSLARGQTPAIGVLSDRAEVAAVTARGAQAGLAPAAVAQRISAGLARLAEAVVVEAAISGLVVTGGDTASAVCAALGAQAVEIVREVEPGIPLSRLVGPRPVLVVIKAGAFGSPEALLVSLQHLTLETRGRQ
jgi:uncharacterized protein YgbK (DUF1537 family)